jgi:hypothetical protein
MKHFFAIALFWLAATAQAAEPVAMVTDLKGTATVVEGGKSARLSLLTYLQPGTELLLDPGSRVVLTYFVKPLEFTFSGPGTVTVGADKAQAGKGTAGESRKLGNAQSDSAKRFAPLQKERVAQAAFVMRGMPKPEIKSVGPVGMVLSTMPKLAWGPPAAAKSYRIAVLDAGGNPVAEGSSDQPAWVVTTELKRGAGYRWKVTATLENGASVSGGGSFTVLAPAQAEPLLAAQPKAGASFSERLLYAARLQSEGLAHDARGLWLELSRERPDDPALRQWTEP